MGNNETITLKSDGATPSGRYRACSDRITEEQGDKLTRAILKACRSCDGMRGCTPNITHTRRPWAAKEDKVVVTGFTVFRPILEMNPGRGWVESPAKECKLPDIEIN